jgi:pimeloyl-ACP methyl ester carboxylesterase
MTYAPLPDESTVAANGVELAHQGFGDPADPALLLLHGAGDSMLSWHEGLCERLAGGGRYVVRYDGRDSGRSTTYEPGSPPYSLRDVVADTAALIDALDLGRVHFAGLSGGGTDGQLLALDYPERVATLTLLATTPGDPTSESPDLPTPDDRVAGAFSAPEPDWTDDDAIVDYLATLERPFAGSGGFDEAAQRDLCRRVVERSADIRAQLTNPFAASVGEGWRGRLGEIEAPTLVIHGDDDPLFPLPHGEALAREIPDAELLVLEGVGHEYPPPRTWDTVVAAILRHTEAR